MKYPKRNTQSEINQLRRRNAQLEEENKYLKDALVLKILSEDMDAFEESFKFFSEHLTIEQTNDIKLIREKDQYFITKPHPIIKWDNQIIFP